MRKMGYLVFHHMWHSKCSATWKGGKLWIEKKSSRIYFLLFERYGSSCQLTFGKFRSALTKRLIHLLIFWSTKWPSVSAIWKLKKRPDCQNQCVIFSQSVLGVIYACLMLILLSRQTQTWRITMFYSSDMDSNGREMAPLVTFLDTI